MAKEVFNFKNFVIFAVAVTMLFHLKPDIIILRVKSVKSLDKVVAREEREFQI
jgi:hypothetical protein